MAGRIPRFGPGMLAAIALLVVTSAVANPAIAAAGVHTSSSTLVSTSSSTSSNGTSSGTIDRWVTDSRLSESSGIASSLTTSGVVWVHNDSGHAARIYAVASSGKVSAVATVKGGSDVDWEAIAAFRDSQGRANLAIGDIGDNTGVHSAIHVMLVREPSTQHSSVVQATRVLRLTYPDQATDAEALLVDQRNQRMYVVTKGLFNGHLYAVPKAVWPGISGHATQSAGTLEDVASVAVSLVTDGTVLSDGRVLLRNYSSLSVMPAMADISGESWSAEDSLTLPSQQQGEGITLTSNGTAVLLNSEGTHQPMIRLTLPTAFRAQSTTATATATATSGTRTTTITTTSGSSGAVQSWFTPRSLLWGGLVLAIVIVILVGIDVNQGRRSPASKRSANHSRRR